MSDSDDDWMPTKAKTSKLAKKAKLDLLPMDKKLAALRRKPSKETRKALLLRLKPYPTQATFPTVRTAQTATALAALEAS